MCRTKQKMRLFHQNVSASCNHIFLNYKRRMFTWFIAKFTVWTWIGISLVASVDWTKVTMTWMLTTTMMRSVFFCPSEYEFCFWWWPDIVAYWNSTVTFMENENITKECLNWSNYGMNMSTYHGKIHSTKTSLQVSI